jgi:hypothetical protein
MKSFLSLFGRGEHRHPSEGTLPTHEGNSTGKRSERTDSYYSPNIPRTHSNVNAHATQNQAHCDDVGQIRQTIQQGKESLVPLDNKLLIFRSLTGIDSVPLLSHHGFFAPRSAPNVGIYTRVVQAEKKAAARYRTFNLLINTCLSIQIVVAAALTAIGAAQGPHGLVTAFGAINTIMAGILTYLRGSGLPGREKNAEKAWSQVREYIEQREREFCLESCELNVEDEIMTVERMYEDVRQQMEASASESGGARGIESWREMRSRGSLLPTAKEAATAGIGAVREAVASHGERALDNIREESRQHTHSRETQTASASGDFAEKDLD